MSFTDKDADKMARVMDARARRRRLAEEAAPEAPSEATPEPTPARRRGRVLVLDVDALGLATQRTVRVRTREP